MPETKQILTMYDNIDGDFIEVDSLEDARKYVKENYVEEDSMHPDFTHFDVFKKVGEVYVEEDAEGNAVAIKTKNESASPEAVEFAEWIAKESYMTTTLRHEPTQLWKQQEYDEELRQVEHPEITSSELYQLFKQSKQ